MTYAGDRSVYARYMDIGEGVKRISAGGQGQQKEKEEEEEDEEEEEEEKGQGEEHKGQKHSVRAESVRIGHGVPVFMCWTRSGLLLHING